MDTTTLRRPLPGHPEVDFVSLPAAQEAGAGPLSKLPYSSRILAEHILRTESPAEAREQLRHLVAAATDITTLPGTVALRPQRVLLQDASGIPVLADLVVLRETVAAAGGDPALVAPRIGMDLVVDHALEVDEYGHAGAAARNLRLERERHADRYQFLDQVAERIPRLRVVPPGLGICHQLNLEVLAQVVCLGEPANGRRLAGFDSVLGTDSHTTMINALGVAGWGVGGIEATAAVLGQPVTFPAPQVVGVRLSGRLGEGALATDIALRLAEMLRAIGVVGRVVEFTGPAVGTLTVGDRATIANMAPEYGATMAFFPSDRATLAYLRATGRPEQHVALAEAFLTAQGMLATPGAPEPRFATTVDLDLSSVGRSMAGPARPHQRLRLDQVPAGTGSPRTDAARARTRLRDGDIVIAAITSCTNTSNPRAMAAAGLLARNAVARGMAVPPWVKTSLAPGSHSASRMLAGTGLQEALDRLGFHVVGHGCATCMGNSGPLSGDTEEEIVARDVAVAAVLSGNRNFPGRVHPRVPAAYLASPPLVVAAALAGSVLVDLERDPLGFDAAGRPVHLHELWPSAQEIDSLVESPVARAALGAAARLLPVAPHVPTDSPHFTESLHSADSTGERGRLWGDVSGSIRRPPFADLAAAGFGQVGTVHGDLLGARQLLLLGDGVTTDDISPVSRIAPDSAAGRWLLERNVAPDQLGSFSSRRLNHDVMLRGGFANHRLNNRLTPGHPGGLTRVFPEGNIVPVHEAAARYRRRGEPVVVVAGASYGAGSARDWAAKVTRLLGVRAVLAAGFERIHRTNLVALGVLPLQIDPQTVTSLSGSETLDLIGMDAGSVPGGTVTVRIHRGNGVVDEVIARARIDTPTEAGWLRSGGLIPGLVAEAADRPAKDSRP
ncbi:aconitate hydratase AcnA [Streptomyces sp. NTH33]|nr:aconitate hydratase AcnA [Streptomyces sp. NTH33]